MDPNWWSNIQSWWDYLMTGFGGLKLILVIGTAVATVIAGALAYIVTRPPTRKRQKRRASRAASVQMQQVVVDVPVAQNSLQQTVATVPVAESVRSVSPIPHLPLVSFVARRDKDGRDLVEYVSGLLANDGGFVALWGPGGIGKTALAAEIAKTAPLTPHPPLPSPDLVLRLRSAPLRMDQERGEGVPKAGEWGEVVWASADGRPDFSLGTLLDTTLTQLGHVDMCTLAPDAKIEAVRDLMAERPDGHGREGSHKMPQEGDHKGLPGDHKGTPLLVVDNFETVAEVEQARIAEFIVNVPCPVLVTSRQMVPQARNVAIGAMGDAEAREFVEKLIAISSRREVFQGLDAGEIVKTAGANPLVMEWVVAQIGEAAQEPQRVLAEMAQGQGDVAPRVFDRSFNLPCLGDDGRVVLLVLTVFVPDATREALAEVAGLDAEQVNNAITHLISLRLADTAALNARVSTAGLGRELARVHREQDPHNAEWTRRFVDHFVCYAQVHGRTMPEDLSALESERENLMAAMDAAFASGDWPRVMRMMDAIGSPVDGFLSLHGYWADAIARGEQAAEAARRASDEEAATRFSGNTATLHYWRGEYAQAKETYSQALEIRKRQGNDRNVAIWLHQLGNIAYLQGDYETAREHYDASLAITTKLGSQRGAAQTLHQLGMVAQAQGDNDLARMNYDESLKIKNRRGDERGMAHTLHQLGNIAYRQGNYEKARARYGESLEIAKRQGDESGMAIGLFQLGKLAELDGNKTRAARFFRQSLKILERLKSPDAEIARKSLERINGSK